MTHGVTPTEYGITFDATGERTDFHIDNIIFGKREIPTENAMLGKMMTLYQLPGVISLLLTHQGL